MPYYIKYVNKLEAVQRHMARFVCDEYGFVSVTNLLKNLSWPILQQREELAIEESCYIRY